MSKRGAIWLVALDPTKGSEIQKTRPAVIVSVREVAVLPVLVIVPITGWQSKHDQIPWMVPLEANKKTGLDKPSSADALQVRCVSTTRLVQKLGVASADTMEQIEIALAKVLGI